MNLPETETIFLVAPVIVALAAATGGAQLLKRRHDTGFNPAVIAQFHLRVRAWWLIVSVLVLAFIVGPITAVVLFGGISFWALREFITLTPTRRGDHRALFWVFFIFTPLQYLLVGFDLHDYYSILIPVCGFLWVTSRVAFAGDFKRFLERTAKIQVGLMISVYCLSYAPALLTHKAFKNPPLPAGAISPAAGGGSAAASATNGGAPASSAGVFPTSTPNDDVELVAQASSQPVTDDVAPREDPLAGTAQENGASPTAPATSGAAPTTPRNPAVGAPAQAIQPAIGQPGGPLSLPQRARLLFYFVVVIQIGDIMQYVWGKLLGKTVIAPDINPERTWEGFAGAVLSGTVLGTLLGLATPFAAWEAALLSAVICAIGFAGGMTMSAIKRDRGVRDYGTLVVGHGGVLDRIDSICFAAPVFFYLTRILLGPYEGV